MTEKSCRRSTAALPRGFATGARAEILKANELELLADRNLELAERYERDAEFMDDYHEQATARRVPPRRAVREGG